MVKVKHYKVLITLDGYKPVQDMPSIFLVTATDCDQNVMDSSPENTTDLM